MGMRRTLAEENKVERGHREQKRKRKMNKKKERLNRQPAAAKPGIGISGAACRALLFALESGLGLMAPILPVHAMEVPSGTITVTNVKETQARVTAYQLVDGTYSAEGKLTGYVLIDEEHMKISNLQQPTAEEIAEIADYIESNPGTVTGTALTLSDSEKGTWRLQTEPGEYLILVTGSGDTVYNPAVVSVNVTDADQMDLQDGTVDIQKAFFENGSSAYLKSSTTDLRKTVLLNGEQVRGRSAAVGESMEFVIDSMTIPSYSESYEKLVFRIHDELESGCFGAVHDLKVLVDGQEVAAGADTWKVTYGSGKTSFDLEFAEGYLRSHGAKAVAVHYRTELQENAGLNFAENTNKAVLQYSNNPAKADEVKEKTAFSYQYTFGLGANIDAEGTKEQQIETGELNKVTRTKGIRDYETTGTTYSGTGATSTSRSRYALGEASFALYSDKGMTQQIASARSDANGHLTFTGLAEGDYYLKETAAPKGYASNDMAYHVNIAAVYRENGSLSEYTVSIREMMDSGEEQTAGSLTYKSDAVMEEDGNVSNTISSDGTAAEILNVPLMQLPSAGGEGTMGFAAAAVGMSGILLIWKRACAGRKSQSDRKV